MKSYNSIDEIKNEFIPLGFHEYKPTQFDHHVITCFQKRYDDEIGKKYFLDIKVYDFTWADILEQYHPSISCQLYQKDTHDAVNLDFINWDIEQVEKFIDTMFKTNMLEHYETWEEC